jgi:hypothetical protein
MANTPSGTILAYTVDIIKDLLTGGKVEPDKLGDYITDIGDRLLDVKHKEEGTVQVAAPARKATPAPTATPVVTHAEETRPAETPATAPEVTQQETPQLGTAEPQRRRGRKKAAEATATVTEKRKPGRPKGSGKKAATTESAQTVSAVSADEVGPSDEEAPIEENILTTAGAPETVTEEETILEFNNPDPKAPDYKFKHLLDRFGVNPDGTAKRFNNMTEEETFDGEIVKSLFDGTTRKMLKRHLGRDYGMTVKEYVTHFGLSPDYRPVGKDFSASKSVDAKKTKLGHKKDEEVEVQGAAEQTPIATPSPVAEQVPIATPSAVKAVRRTRARNTQAA